MRMIGEIQGEAAAQTFGDFLCAHGLGHELERGANDAWAVWIKSDDDCDRAREFLRTFAHNPSDPLFRNAAPEAAAIRRRESEDLASHQRRTRSAHDLFPNMVSHRLGPLTLALIILSVLVFVFSKFGNDFSAMGWLWFSEYEHRGPLWKRVLDLPELRGGQLWRLVTPIFIHLGIMHIVFNMMWLADLGRMIEGRQSTALLGRLVIVLAIGSNIVQYTITGQPTFGGMSGVVYGLIGYIWIRGKFDPGCGLHLNRNTVITSIIWFFLCFTGMLGPIANGAHAGGLLLGMLWGWLAARRPA